MVANWFGFLSVRVCGMLAHGIHFQLIKGFQTNELYFLFKVCNNLFNCAIFDMGPNFDFFRCS